LDGDGCSADCMDMDIYTPPCEIKMGFSNQSIMDIHIKSDNGDIFGFTNSGIIGRLSVTSMNGLDFDWKVVLNSKILTFKYARGFLYAILENLKLMRISTENAPYTSTEIQSLSCNGSNIEGKFMDNTLGSAGRKLSTM